MKSSSFFNIFLVLLLVYFFIIIFLFFYQRKLLYHPGENNYLDDASLNHKIEKIYIPSDSIQSVEPVSFNSYEPVVM